MASTAVTSTAGYILGIGDRHLDNILWDLSSPYLAGSVVHIDFTVAFDRGRLLKVPELVPFRLTTTLRGAMGLPGALSPSGPFAGAAVAAFEAMRGGLMGGGEWGGIGGEWKGIAAGGGGGGGGRNKAWKRRACGGGIWDGALLPWEAEVVTGAAALGEHRGGSIWGGWSQNRVGSATHPVKGVKGVKEGALEAMLGAAMTLHALTHSSSSPSTSPYLLTLALSLSDAAKSAAASVQHSFACSHISAHFMYYAFSFNLSNPIVPHQHLIETSESKNQAHSDLVAAQEGSKKLLTEEEASRQALRAAMEALSRVGDQHRGKARRAEAKAAAAIDAVGEARRWLDDKRAALAELAPSLPPAVAVSGVSTPSQIGGSGSGSGSVRSAGWLMGEDVKRGESGGGDNQGRLYALVTAVGLAAAATAAGAPGAAGGAAAADSDASKREDWQTEGASVGPGMEGLDSEPAAGSGEAAVNTEGAQVGAQKEGEEEGVLREEVARVEGRILFGSALASLLTQLTADGVSVAQGSGRAELAEECAGEQHVALPECQQLPSLHVASQQQQEPTQQESMLPCPAALTAAPSLPFSPPSLSPRPLSIPSPSSPVPSHPTTPPARLPARPSLSQDTAPDADSMALSHAFESTQKQSHAAAASSDGISAVAPPDSTANTASTASTASGTIGMESASFCLSHPAAPCTRAAAGSGASNAAAAAATISRSAGTGGGAAESSTTPEGSEHLVPPLIPLPAFRESLQAALDALHAARSLSTRHLPHLLPSLVPSLIPSLLPSRDPGMSGDASSLGKQAVSSPSVAQFLEASDRIERLVQGGGKLAASDSRGDDSRGGEESSSGAVGGDSRGGEGSSVGSAGGDMAGDDSWLLAHSAFLSLLPPSAVSAALAAPPISTAVADSKDVAETVLPSSLLRLPPSVCLFVVRVQLVAAVLRACLADGGAANAGRAEEGRQEIGEKSIAGTEAEGRGEDLEGQEGSQSREADLSRKIHVAIRGWLRAYTAGCLGPLVEGLVCQFVHPANLAAVLHAHSATNIGASGSENAASAASVGSSACAAAAAAAGVAAAGAVVGVDRQVLQLSSLIGHFCQAEVSKRAADASKQHTADETPPGPSPRMHAAHVAALAAARAELAGFDWLHEPQLPAGCVTPVPVVATLGVSSSNLDAAAGVVAVHQASPVPAGADVSGAAGGRPAAAVYGPLLMDVDRAVADVAASSVHLQAAQQAERAARAAQVETTEARQAAQKLVDRLSDTLQQQSANHSAALSQAHQAAAGLSLAAASLAPFLSHSIVPLIRQVSDAASAVQGSTIAAIVTPDIVTCAERVHSECRSFVDLLESVQGATSPLPSSHPHHLSALLNLSTSLHQQCSSLLPSVSHLARTTLSALHTLRLSKHRQLAAPSASPAVRESELAAEAPPAGRVSVEALDSAVLAVCRREAKARQHAEQVIWHLQQKLNKQDPLLLAAATASNSTSTLHKPATFQKMLSTKKVVRQLLVEACSPDNLCEMYEGWMPWI
ncbi:unnamed protein product [Closterium sp. Yama58-4]|nr:unnamed protein product [Closterium sp. Yama58-4]